MGVGVAVGTGALVAVGWAIAVGVIAIAAVVIAAVVAVGSAIAVGVIAIAAVVAVGRGVAVAGTEVAVGSAPPKAATIRAKASIGAPNFRNLTLFLNLDLLRSPLQERRCTPSLVRQSGVSPWQWLKL
jgi:disulfide bond formation protein DsbB